MWVKRKLTFGLPPFTSKVNDVKMFVENNLKLVVESRIYLHTVLLIAIVCLFQTSYVSGVKGSLLGYGIS